MPSDEEFRRLLNAFNRLKLEFEQLQRQHLDIWPPRRKAASSGSGTIELVTLTSDGGGAGDDTPTSCDWTYSFTTADAVSHTTVSPDQNRLPIALEATYGLWDSGLEVLIALDELPDGGPCS